MNLCIITSSYPRTASESESAGVFVRDFALELSHQGHNVFILTQNRDGKVKDDSELMVVRFPWYGKDKPLSTLNPINPVDIIKTISIITNGTDALLKLVKEKNIDHCLAMWAVPAGIFAYNVKQKIGTPYTVWALGSDIWNYGRHPILKKIVKKILINSKDIFADGIALCDEVTKLSNRDCSFLSSSRKLPLNNIKTNVVDKNNINFLFIGRYHKNKGVDILIDAISLISKDRLQNMRFHFFGGGKLEKTIIAKTKKFNLEKYVKINGFINSQNAASFLNECDCIIIPSRIESIPCVMSDALQSKTPIIATNVGDMGTLLNKYNAGIVVNADSPNSLSNAITNFEFVDKSNLLKGMENLYKLFNIEKSVTSFINSLEAI